MTLDPNVAMLDLESRDVGSQCRDVGIITLGNIAKLDPDVVTFPLFL